MQHRAVILKRYLDAKVERETQALFALQALVHKLEHPNSKYSFFINYLIDEKSYFNCIKALIFLYLSIIFIFNYRAFTPNLRVLIPGRCDNIWRIWTVGAIKRSRWTRREGSCYQIYNSVFYMASGSWPWWRNLKFKPNNFDRGLRCIYVQ